MAEVMAVEEEELKVYKRRYAILASVVLLNISNATLWISYGIVATTAAEFYETDTAKINWFSSSYMLTTLVFAFVTTYVVDKFGLRAGIWTGAILNVVGAIIKAIGSSSLIDDKSAQYGVALFGQELTAMAQSFVLFIPTKVSQTWFPESQRAISTTILAMSNPLGIVVAVLIVPGVVQDAEDINLNDIIWMALAIASFIVAGVCNTKEKPKLPPSRSAQEVDSRRESYFSQLKSAFTNFAFIQLMIVLGGGIGVFTAISTLAEQMLCPLGYSAGLAGLSIALMVLLGFVGSAVTGIYVDKTKNFIEITKIFFGFAAISLILMFEFYLVPDKAVLLSIFSGLFGFFGVGAYPVGLELAVEATYPVEETISTAFVFLSGQITAFIIVILIPITATPQDPSLAHLNVCASDVAPKSYIYEILGLMVYLSVCIMLMIIFLNTKYKRLEAEKRKLKEQQNRGEECLSLT